MPAKNHQNQTMSAVHKRFSDYLKSKNLRKTPERIAILNAIYSIEGHFDVEELLNRMHDQRFFVSRATLYNTIELLLDSDLLIKHRFSENRSQYEKTQSMRQHDHVLILDSGEVMEFCDPRIQEIQNAIEKHFNIKIESHSLVFYAKKSKQKRNKKYES